MTVTSNVGCGRLGVGVCAAGRSGAGGRRRLRHGASRKQAQQSGGDRRAQRVHTVHGFHGFRTFAGFTCRRLARALDKRRAPWTAAHGNPLRDAAGLDVDDRHIV